MMGFVGLALKVLFKNFKQQILLIHPLMTFNPNLHLDCTA